MNITKYIVFVIERNTIMKKEKLKKKFNYWLDKQMAKGTISIIRLLTTTVFSVVVFVSLLIFLFKLRSSFFSAFWDSLATIINAWMPSSDDGEAGYIVLNTFTAIVGLFFTSILIGVVSSGIEERIDSLRKGNSAVLEQGHTVILGYNCGEHGLLKQLILATGFSKRCIVIFTDIEKPDMEQDLKNNVEIPKNITVLCRNGDITNINDLRCCSIETAEIVIVNAMNDNRRIKAILAASSLLKEYKDAHVRLIACVTNDKYMLPQQKTTEENITMLKTADIMAKIIAHTTTEPGLSIAFKELMNFEENELYFEKSDQLRGKSVMQISGSLNYAAMVGIKHDGKIIMNPRSDFVVGDGDELILFEQMKGQYRIRKQEEKNLEDRLAPKMLKEAKGKIGIFGYNGLLKIILSELPEDVRDICILSDKKEVCSLAKKYPKRNIEIVDTSYENHLEKYAGQFSHIVLLTDREKEKEDADIDTILLLLKLQDIMERRGFDYNIVAELNMEGSYNISLKSKNIDYIVNSSISSLILAQIAESPDLEYVFNELLTNKGNELYSKPIRNFNLNTKHDYSFDALKRIVLSYGYTLLGAMHEGNLKMNPDLDERIIFDEDDRLIVLGRE